MPFQSRETASPVRVLIVCTGNICRSPLAEQLLRLETAKAGLTSQLLFESAGTRAEVGQSTNPDSLKSALTRSIEPFNIVARQITQDMVNSSELVLTATTEHRGDVVRLVAGANRKTFTIKEFARILEFLADDNEHLEENDRTAMKSAANLADIIALASQYRGFARPAIEGDDIIDPWGRTREVFDAVTDELILASQKLIRALEPVMKHEN
ncbi:MAG: low molecular weight phosphatase family protein [Actinomycetes bacterium]